MVLDHFRTTSKDEVLFNASHIYKLQYRGDKEMDKFLHAWIEIIANMKAEDIPSDNTLRDHSAEEDRWFPGIACRPHDLQG